MTEFTALVTGGSKGIGSDLAVKLADRGYRVLSLARGKPDWTHDRVEHHSVDLLDPQAVKQAAQELAAGHEITHIVNNAGLIWPNLVEEASPEDIRGLAQLHLGAPLTLLQAALPAMKARGFGRVLFNGSRAALGVPTRSAYSATKAGLVGLARTWALELALHGITVNVVAPGPVQTDNFWGIIPKGSDREAQLAERIPVGRLGRVEDVSNAFLFFCDPASSFVTGQVLYVCGGTSVGSVTL
jgi:NAD(P)-dependent dehydrogenase (short-subunit alcohol dehydrogenase family)